MSVFHVELKRFPRQAHAFNLSEAQLKGTILAPWLRNQVIELGDQKWIPDRTDLRIVEGEELEPGDMGVGRGWTIAQRSGKDVTREMLAKARGTEEQKAVDERSDYEREILARCADELVSLHEAWRLANSFFPTWRVSDRLVAAENAVRDLLYVGQAELCRGARATAAEHVVPGRDIEALLLTPESWTSDDGMTVFLRATANGRRALSTTRE